MKREKDLSMKKDVMEFNFQSLMLNDNSLEKKDPNREFFMMTLLSYKLNH